VTRIDRIQWRKILRSFSGVRTLYVVHDLIGVISRSLRSEDGESPLELLPNLEKLTYSGSDITNMDMFGPFIKQRRAAGLSLSVGIVAYERSELVCVLIHQFIFHENSQLLVHQFSSPLQPRKFHCPFRPFKLHLSTPYGPHPAHIVRPDFCQLISHCTIRV
jgi:hypothetical protein